MIKLSIVTPTYNRKEKLSININSVKNQIYKNIEHILVDNLSDDGTVGLINDYKKDVEYPVTYIRESDTGIYNAINKGIKAARGEWIHILHSDDMYFDKNVLNYLFIHNGYDNYDMLCSSIILKNYSKKKETYWKPEYNEKIKHFRFPHPGMIIKNNFYDMYGLYNEKYKIVSDAIYQIDNIPRAKYVIIDKPLVIMDDSGVSTKITFRNIYESIVCTLFYHKYPLVYKIKKIIFYLNKPIKILLRFYVCHGIINFKNRLKEIFNKQ